MANVSIAKGARTTLNYALQTDAQVTPTEGWKNLPFKSVSLGAKYDLTKSETIRDSRIESAGLVTKATVDGDIGVEFARTIYDDFLAAVAFNDWQGDVLTIGGTTEKMIAIERIQKDIGVAELYNACMVNNFKMSISEGKLVDATFGLMGRGYESKLDGTTFSTNITPAPATIDKASSLTVEDIKVDGLTVKGRACAKAFDLEINNNAQVIACLGGGIYASGLAELQTSVSGNLTLAYSKVSKGFVDNQITGKTLKLEVTIGLANGGSYVFAMPMIQVSGDTPSGGINDILDQQIKYTVVEQAMTITRVPAAK